MTFHPELSVGFAFIPFLIVAVVLLGLDAWRTSRLPRVVRETVATRFPGAEVCWFDPPSQFTPDVYILYVRYGDRLSAIRVSSEGRILVVSSLRCTAE